MLLGGAEYIVATLKIVLDVINGNKSGKRQQEYHGVSEVELSREKCAFCGKTSKIFAGCYRNRHRSIQYRGIIRELRGEEARKREPEKRKLRKESAKRTKRERKESEKRKNVRRKNQNRAKFQGSKLSRRVPMQQRGHRK